MSELDAKGSAQLVRRVRVCEEHEVEECLAECDGTGDSFVRLMERKGYLTSWQGSKVKKADPDGYILGGYKLLYKIAAGSFGRVFRAEDPHSKQIVAVKVLRRRWSEDQHKIGLFEREGKMGIGLTHPNIVQVLAVNRDAPTGQYYIVMEFVEGGNLRDIINSRKKLPLFDALQIMEEAALGLAHAQTRGMTHRDLKPSNILIATNKVAKLVDFGLAAITGPSDDDTEVDRTVDYAGLERATGAKTGDVRSDIYFLGCIFFEIITGRPLLTVTRDKNARMNPRRFDIISSVKRDDPDLPPVAYSLLQRMVALDPRDRYQTPADLVEALRQAQGKRGEATEAIAGHLAASGPPTVFVVEANTKLQEVFREKLRGAGYRVLMSHDPDRPLAMYKTKPFHALILDAGSAGEASAVAVDKVLDEAAGRMMTCYSIVIVNEDQKRIADGMTARPDLFVMTRPVTLRQILDVLREKVPAGEPQ